MFNFLNYRNASDRSRGWTDPSTRLLIGLLVLFSLTACSSRFNVFSESRDERLRRYDQELARLAGTSDPVDRTRIQVRISDLLISFMGDAVSDSDLEVLEQRIVEYRETVTDAHTTMFDSGRDASRQAAGFQDLEIALRQHIRQLDDIAMRLPFGNREPIVGLIDEVAVLRDELLGALFPGREPA